MLQRVLLRFKAIRRIGTWVYTIFNTVQIIKLNSNLVEQLTMYINIREIYNRSKLQAVKYIHSHVMRV